MIRRTTASRTVIALFVVVASSAFAGRPNGAFVQKHPRRAEVNARERNQNRRIHQGVKNGTMTKDEAKEARGNLRDIKREERAEVKANGGHLTKAQQRDLNQQLNQNSKEIYQEKHDGSVGTPPAVAPAAPVGDAPAAQ